MEVSVGGTTFTVVDDEFGPFWQRVTEGDWESASYDVLDRLLTPDATFVDVGAWIGPLTLYAAHRARHCHAVEPDPVARATLVANIDRNADVADRIEVHDVAVAPAAGEIRLGNITSAAGGDSMSSLLFASAPTSWTVAGVPLGELLEHLDDEPPGLVKIDIEGAEVEVLAAARDYLERTRTPLYLSVHGRFWPDPVPRMQLLLDVLSIYPTLLTPGFDVLDRGRLLDDDHLRGLFELVAL